MHQEKKLVRILTCGSVDNGKSTLIGRLMLDSKALMEDQIASVTKSQFSRGELNLAMFTDGLTEERERGITIDVAYRYFSTPTHKFILADCPGHAEYTRNMATGASNSDIALILVDPNYALEHGDLEAQTKLHYRICNLFDLAIIFVVNKADTIAWDSYKLEEVEDVIAGFAKGSSVVHISALTGANVSTPSSEGWSPSLLGLILHLADDRADERASDDGATVTIRAHGRASKRIAVGNVLGGTLRINDPVRLYRARGNLHYVNVEHLSILGKRATEVVAGDAIEIGLSYDDLFGEGDVITSGNSTMRSQSTLQTTLVWMGDSAAIPDHPGYIVRTELGSVPALISRVTSIMDTADGYGIPVEAYSPMANDIAIVQLTLDGSLLVPEKEGHNAPGRKFILIDQKTGDTVAAGFID